MESTDLRPSPITTARVMFGAKDKKTAAPKKKAAAAAAVAPVRPAPTAVAPSLEEEGPPVLPEMLEKV